ncbi:hypothetical protein FH972_005726 [Carpinus fangiana]|uniref:Uncharacterized protein n=1 Tax=Carpinus fangiana TaxID=176857 RepID=A0A5N6QTE3_9ROSI|nr:hypothetical protein FH972_005726 [Carpinus fangiana]
MKLKNVEIEKESLVVKLHEVDVVNDSLKHENSMLIDKVKSLEDVCNSFDDNFDCILGSNKMFENKCELDSVKIAFALKTTLVNKGKMIFSPPPCVDICPPVVNKGERIGIDSCVTNSKSRKLDKGKRVLGSVGPKVFGQGKKVIVHVIHLFGNFSNNLAPYVGMTIRFQTKAAMVVNTCSKEPLRESQREDRAPNPLVGHRNNSPNDGQPRTSNDPQGHIASFDTKMLQNSKDMATLMKQNKALISRMPHGRPEQVVWEAEHYE